MVKTNFILLAAGASTRMGQDKALLPYKEHVWLSEQVKTISMADLVQTLYVVCQPVKKEIYEQTLASFRSPQFHIQFVVNPDGLSKPSDSIRCALKEAECSSGSFVSPIDVPLRKEVLQNFNLSEASFVRPTYQNRPGHPVWLSGSLLSRFSKTTERLDEFLRQQSAFERRQEFSCSEIVLNLNTPEAWEKFVAEERSQLFEGASIFEK